MTKHKLTVDQLFSRWVRRVCILFCLLFVYYLIADLKMPVTPQAMVERPVIQVSPQVSGTVTRVDVVNNQKVKAGEPLFAIDSRPYQLALDKAKLALRQAKLTNDELDASIQSAQAEIQSTAAVLHQRKRDAQRIAKLYRQHAVSSSREDQAISEEQTAQASYDMAVAKLQGLKVQRGIKGPNNLLLRQALNQLDSAKLNLSYTQVKASQDGVVSNMQLQSGTMADSGQPLLAIVADKIDVVADFREKNLRHVRPGSKAVVAFDSHPGVLYDATVDGIDAGVSSGQFNANGLLATPSESNRWVRDAQRLRVHLKVRNMPELASGARATVQLLPSSMLLSAVAKAQIWAISALHFVY